MPSLSLNKQQSIWIKGGLMSIVHQFDITHPI